MRPRGLVLVAVGYILTVLQASLQSVVPVRVLVPELSFLVALYAGMTARDRVGGACGVAFVLGYVTDLLAGAPKGLFALTFVLLCLLAKGASLRLLLTGRIGGAAFAFVASLVSGMVVLLARSHLDASGLRPILVLPLQAAVTALFAPLVFWALARLERKPASAAQAGFGR
jgi:rod shape-determining protein MreD